MISIKTELPGSTKMFFVQHYNEVCLTMSVIWYKSAVSLHRPHDLLTEWDMAQIFLPIRLTEIGAQAGGWNWGLSLRESSEGHSASMTHFSITFSLFMELHHFSLQRTKPRKLWGVKLIHLHISSSVIHKTHYLQICPCCIWTWTIDKRTQWLTIKGLIFTFSDRRVDNSLMQTIITTGTGHDAWLLLPLEGTSDE